MGSFVINYPDGQGIRILNALCERWNYDESLHGSSKQAFVKNYIARWLKQSVQDVELEAAIQAATESALVEPPDIEAG